MKKKLITVLVTSVLIIMSLTGCAKETKQDNEGVITKPTDGAATDTLLSQIQAAGVLQVGTEGTYAPYTFHDDNDDLVGYDVEIAQAVAEKLGVKAEFVETKWDSIIAGLDAKRFDVVINQVGITEDRLAKYDFSTPYTYTKGALIISGSNKDISKFEDLEGKKSAQALTSNFATLAESYGAELVGTDGFSQSIELVLTGRADATINDDVTFYDYMKQKPDADVKIAALSEESSANAVLIRKGNESLVEAINTALSELTTEGTLKEISEKYFGTDISVK